MGARAAAAPAAAAADPAAEARAAADAAELAYEQAARAAEALAAALAPPAAALAADHSLTASAALRALATLPGFPVSFATHALRCFGSEATLLACAAHGGGAPLSRLCSRESHQVDQAVACAGEAVRPGREQDALCGSRGRAPADEAAARARALLAARSRDGAASARAYAD
jgi:hypothetical protein